MYIITYIFIRIDIYLYKEIHTCLLGDVIYNSKTYNVNEDLEVNKIIDINELSPYTVATYYSVLKQFTKCIGKSYFDFVNEVKELQRDEIIGNKIIRYNPNDSKVNEYIHKYMNFLVEKGNKKSTVNVKIKQLLVLLKKSNVEVPKIAFKTEAKQNKVQLITTDDIRFILNHSNTHHRALFTFMASTGIRRYDIVNTFKIEDFIEGCSDYVDAVFLDEFLEKAPENMMPYFEFIPHKTMKTGLPCKVCCTPESSNLIIRSLKSRVKSIERHNKEKGTDLKLTEECPLFTSKKKNFIGKFDDNSISGIFFHKNKLLRNYKEKELDTQLRNREISKKEWRVKRKNIPKFHPHSLRYRFISTIRAYTTNRDISLLMEGHASSINTDKFYVGESEELFNKESIKQTYSQVLPYLTFFQDIDPISYVKEKEKNNELQNKINSLEKKISEFEGIKEYLDEHSVLNDIL